MSLIPTPHCCICNKPVDEATWWDEFSTNRLTIRSKCHGQVDTSSVSMEIFTLRNMRIEPLKIFQEKQIEDHSDFKPQ